MGCGRTGALLATEFEGRGHSVAVIDQLSDAFRRLPSDFAGQKITGIGFDRDTLVAAGVEDAYAFAAVSDGDNSNILAARVVRETYGVTHVVARIADPGRAEVYQRLGIATVAPVPWTVTQIVSQLLPGAGEGVYTDASAGITMAALAVPAAWVGRPYAEVEAATDARIAYVVRFGGGVIPEADTLIHDGDEPYFAFPAGQSTAIERILARDPDEVVATTTTARGKAAGKDRAKAKKTATKAKPPATPKAKAKPSGRGKKAGS